MGIIDGVTTNPSLIAKETKSFKEIIKEIVSVVNGPISVEATAEKAENIIKEGEKYSKINKNIVIKVAMNEEGLKAIKELTGIDEAQVINYLKATGLKIGLLINFGAESLEHKRLLRR